MRSLVAAVTLGEFRSASDTVPCERLRAEAIERTVGAGVDTSKA
jgi:hypothetical protein